MKFTYRVSIAADSIRCYEPFTELQIRAIQIVNDQCEWRSFTDYRVEFFSVYGKSANNGLFYILADCLDLETAREVAEAFNILSRFTLPIIEHPNV